MLGNQRSAKVSKTFTRTPLLRAAALIVAAASVIVVLLAARHAQGREQAVNEEFDGYELAITAPLDLRGFADATIWSLPSQNMRLFSDDSTPTASFSTIDSGAIVGLESAQGLVALGIVPPGLGEAPDELLISPASTALAIAALHPEVTAGDSDTYLARLAIAARSDGFGEVAASVDGVTPLAQWGSDQRAAVERMIVGVVEASASIEPTCAGSVVVGGPIVQCPGSDQLQNLGARSVAVADSTGALCQVVPPVSLRASAADLALLRELAGLGEATPAAAAVVAPSPQPGAIESQGCDGELRIFVESEDNPGWVTESGRVGTWLDDSLAIARYLGPVKRTAAELGRSGIVETPADPMFDAGPLNATQRLQAASRVVSSPAASAAVGSLPLTAEAIGELDHLADLLERLFT